MTALQEAERPRDVLRAAGAVMGEELDGFTWLRSAERLERTAGDRTGQISFQNSHYNRAGGPLTINLYLSVRDGALRRWRAAHPDVALHDDDILIAHPLGYVSGRAHGRVYGSWEDGVLDLADRAQRTARVKAVIAVVRNNILPWFAETADPDTLVTIAPTFTVTSSASRIIEWLASLDRRDLIGPLVARVLAGNPGLRDGLDRGRQLAGQGTRPPGGDTAAWTGWAAAVHS